MSLPTALRRPDDTVPSEPSGFVCPRCRQRFPAENAPTLCPTDGSALVRPRDLAAEPHDPMVGRTLEGRYTIVARLGAGSMGTVYRAKQHAMGREVAIKILRGDRAADDSAKARFMREARANSLLASPNTVTVFDFGQSESGEFYLAMEILDGESLGQRLTRVGRLAPAVAVDAARQALRSLAEAHAKGIIHRDLKPDNLFFARVVTGSMRPPAMGLPPGSIPPPPIKGHEEIVKVLDFGIAKMLNVDEQPMGVVETQAGTVFGTPRYMSPEQAQGKPLDARSDLYSLGVIVYQMLTGRPPFTDDDAVVVMARHIKSTPKKMSDVCPEANIPRELEMVVMRTLGKTPEERPESAEVLAGELLSALEAQGATTSGVRASVTNAAGIPLPESMRPPPVPLPTPRRRVPVVAAVLGGVVVLVAALVFLALARSSGGGKADRTDKPEGRRSTTTASAASDPPTSTAGVTPDGTAGASASAEPLTPDSLPRVLAPGIAPGVAPGVAMGSPPSTTAGGRKGASATGTAKAGKPAGSTRAPGPEVAPATSASPYGIFE